MADINEVSGVFGGVEIGTIGEENNVNVNASSNLPVKVGFWNKFKAAMFQEVNWKHEIKVVLTQ